MTQTHLVRATVAVSALGGIGTLSFMLYAAQPWSPGAEMKPALIVFLAWAVLPYVCHALMSRPFQSQRAIVIALFIGALLSVLVANAAYFYGMFIHPDAQGGLIFLFMPLYQLLFCGGLRLAVPLFPRVSLTPIKPVKFQLGIWVSAIYLLGSALTSFYYLRQAIELSPRPLPLGDIGGTILLKLLSIAGAIALLRRRKEALYIVWGILFINIFTLAWAAASQRSASTVRPLEMAVALIINQGPLLMVCLYVWELKREGILR